MIHGDIHYRNHIETFKITPQFDMWHLHSHDGRIEAFSSLTELAKSIKTQGKQTFRVAPSEYGKSFRIELKYNFNLNLFIYVNLFPFNTFR